MWQDGPPQEQWGIKSLSTPGSRVGDRYRLATGSLSGMVGCVADFLSPWCWAPGILGTKCSLLSLGKSVGRWWTTVHRGLGVCYCTHPTYSKDSFLLMHGGDGTVGRGESKGTFDGRVALGITPLRSGEERQIPQSWRPAASRCQWAQGYLSS